LSCWEGEGAKRQEEEEATFNTNSIKREERTNDYRNFERKEGKKTEKGRRDRASPMKKEKKKKRGLASNYLYRKKGGKRERE